MLQEESSYRVSRELACFLKFCRDVIVYVLVQNRTELIKRRNSPGSRLRAVDCLSSKCGSVPQRVEALCLRRTRLANHTSRATEALELPTYLPRNL
jgi:hypothetical protein